MSSAPAPTQASAGGPGMPRPQPQQPSTTGQGTNSVMIRPLFALEDVVLYIFVVVPSFFVWIFDSVYSRAMYVPGLSNMLRPLSSSSSLAEGPPSAPPEPANVTRATPRTSGSRSSWSTRGHIVEGILSIGVYVCMLRGHGFVRVPSSSATSLLNVILYLSVYAAIETCISWHFGMRTRLGVHRNEDITDLDGVDLSEYDFFQYISNFKAIMIAGLVLPGTLALCASHLDFFASRAWHETFFLGMANAIFCLCGVVLLYNTIPFVRKATFCTLYKWHNLFINQPRCRHVRLFLLANGMIYIGLLHFSDVPSGLTWSLIMTHSTRLLRLLVALRGDNEDVADAATEILEHVQEAV